MATPILLTIGMHIQPTRLFEFGPLSVEYDLQGRLREGCTDANWDDEGEIEDMTNDDDKDNDDKDSQNKTRRLKKEKQQLK